MIGLAHCTLTKSSAESISTVTFATKTIQKLNPLLYKSELSPGVIVASSVASDETPTSLVQREQESGILPNGAYAPLSIFKGHEPSTLGDRDVRLEAQGGERLDESARGEFR